MRFADVLRFFDKKSRRAIVVAIIVGVIGLFFTKVGGGESSPKFSFSCSGNTIGHREGDKNFFTWLWLLMVRATESRPDATARNPEPKTVEPAPPAPTPEPPSEPQQQRVEVLRKETTRLDRKVPAPSPPAESTPPDPPAQPPSSPGTAADPAASSAPVTVLRIDGKEAKALTGSANPGAGADLSGKIEVKGGASATLSTASATAVLNPLPGPHGPGAVVEEEGCGSLQDGRWVPPPPPHAEVDCIVREEINGEVTRTTYRASVVP